MTRVAVETKTLCNLFCMENFPEKSEKNHASKYVDNVA